MLNNKGFAITTILYGILILFIMLVLAMLGILHNYKNNLSKLVEKGSEIVKYDHPVSFATDSWATIRQAVQDGNTDVYKVGNTKTITLASHTNSCSSKSGNGGEFECILSEIPAQTVTLRIANKSTPSECFTSGFSQTACGFVVEFVDIIDKHNMNPADATNIYGTNIGGWPASSMYEYVAIDTSPIFQALPCDLQKVIIPTYVVSGHGKNDTSGTLSNYNFESTDYLYLLSGHEVWEDDSSNQVSTFDTAYSKTRQLDYYSDLGVTTINYSRAIQQYSGSNLKWWLRGANFDKTNDFMNVNIYGYWNYFTFETYSAFGVSPAFRIG